MCTAVTYKTKDFYFGRTLDYEHSYTEELTITPRNFPLVFRNARVVDKHFAIIGMAFVQDGYPLYYDAVNEKGLGMAGLNFVGNAVYSGFSNDKDNIAQFEFIPWILSQCTNVTETKALLSRINITNTKFSESLPVAQLHWIIADRDGAITVESVKDGIHIYENPVGVLTNNPTFPEQLFNLNNYMHLSPKEPKNQFSDKLDLKAYSRGMGTLGLPGDLSSQSRFVRAAFTKMNSVSGSGENESVGQFFHILDSVAQPRGCCEVENGQYEITIYSSCCNCDKGIYYYTSYENRQITAVDMRSENIDGNILVKYPLVLNQQINMQN